MANTEYNFYSVYPHTFLFLSLYIYLHHHKQVHYQILYCNSKLYILYNFLIAYYH